MAWLTLMSTSAYRSSSVSSQRLDHDYTSISRYLVLISCILGSTYRLKHPSSSYKDIRYIAKFALGNFNRVL